MNTNKMKRTAQQSILLNTLIAKLKIDKETKQLLVYQFTNERETSSSEMLFNECNNLINHLRRMLGQNTIQTPVKQQLNREKMDKQRKRLIAKFREMGYNTDDNKADMQRVNETLVKHWHKTINEFDKEELQKVIAVVEHKFIPNYYNKHAAH